MSLYFRTLSHLKPIQVFYQVKNRIVKSHPLKYYQCGFNGEWRSLQLCKLPEPPKVVQIKENRYVFTFLNLTKEFSEKIDWNFNEFGKLWNYNLQYLNFLHQSDIPISEKIGILLDIYSQLWVGRIILEPYPVSLRIMNVIRFINDVGVDRFDNEIFHYLRSEANYLFKNLEYHLLANHLLENGFALLMAGQFFHNKIWKNKAQVTLEKEINEQILNDGAHFELSPMYHQILLFRFLEAYSYLPNSDSLKKLIKEKINLMISWLNSITFRNGNIPHFNDSAEGIAFNSNQLNILGKKLGFTNISKLPLGQSGYRRFDVNEMELIFDIQGINPKYQPGHAHADTFSFCLNYNNTEIIVDLGVSTYEISHRRDYERSTTAHNTISINNKNSSEVWAGFRVGRRAKVSVQEDEEFSVIASHDGFKKEGVIVSRHFKVEDKTFFVQDVITCKRKPQIAYAHLHFSPGLEVTLEDGYNILIGNELKFTIFGIDSLELCDYDCPLGFNHKVKAKKAVIRTVQNQLVTKIQVLK